MKLSDFHVTSGTLGEGAFGKVRRCRVIASGKVFALKQMQKADIVSMGQVEHIMQETQILSTISHPFVTNKFASVTTPSNLILIMEFCPGGDLFDQLYKHKSFNPDDTAIYSSQAPHSWLCPPQPQFIQTNFHFALHLLYICSLHMWFL